eukprot:9477159-Pyramimonas_sp.AAC.1
MAAGTLNHWISQDGVPVRSMTRTPSAAYHLTHDLALRDVAGLLRFARGFRLRKSSHPWAAPAELWRPVFCPD